MGAPRRLTLVVVAALAAGLAPASGASAVGPSEPATREVVLVTAMPLRATPVWDARVVRQLRSRAPDGAPTQMMTGTTQTTDGVSWVHVTDAGISGWVRESGTAQVAVPSLPAGLRQRLTGLAGSVPGNAGFMVMDRAGQVEWSLRPDRARILASNTKLFVTGRVAHRRSQVGAQLQKILLPSNNVLAQQMYAGEGGATPVMRFAQSLGASVTLSDGSGLSRANRASPRDVARYLVGMATDQHFSEWLDALPVAGVSGTLADRMVGTVAQGRCHAKTGTLTGVSALSGYCTTLRGHRLVFSILMNGVGNVDQARAVQDRMVELLVARG